MKELGPSAIILTGYTKVQGGEDAVGSAGDKKTLHNMWLQMDFSGELGLYRLSQLQVAKIPVGS